MSTDQIIDLSFKPDSGKKEVETIDSSKFLMLYLLSLGLYSIWWMYKTWKFFKEKESLDIMPVWRSIFSIFFIYSLFNKILNFAKQNNPEVKSYSSGLLAVLYIIVSLCSRLPEPYWMIAFGACLCFIQPINTFNSAVESSDQYEAKRETGMSVGQIVIVIVGSLLWLLMLIGLFAPVEPEY